MSFRSVEMLTSSVDPEFGFWDEDCVDNPNPTGKDIELFQSKKI